MERSPLIDQYIALLKNYNESVNIFSKNAYDHLDFHVADSINMANLVGNVSETVIDMGSGGGFPSVIIAIQNPKNQVIAIESKTKKARFLDMVKTTLALPNYQVINEDVHQVLKRFSAAFYTAKAFKKYPEVISIIQQFAKPKSICIIPISQSQVQEIRSTYEVKTIEAYYYLYYQKC